MNYTDLGNNNRVYKIDASCIFKKNDEQFGGLSNMATIFITEVNGIKTTSTESIYQACKFPMDLELQRRILYERSPFTAKLIAKKGTPRQDWDNVKVKIMRWCLQVKLAQNYNSFGLLLKSTENKNIVENSNKDQFWGAKKINDFELQGRNALGRLLMELRQDYLSKPKDELLVVHPLPIKDFSLLGKEIEMIDIRWKYMG